jgi:hypothetical protein
MAPPVEFKYITARENLLSCGYIILYTFGLEIPWIQIQFADNGPSWIRQTKDFFGLLGHDLLEDLIRAGSVCPKCGKEPGLSVFPNLAKKQFA